MNLSEFFAMGGYAWYVWPSYALALVVLAANLLTPVAQRRRLLRELGRKARRARRTDEPQA